MPTIIGYHPLDKNFIASIEIDSNSSDLNRPDVFDKNHALFVCQEAKIIAIDPISNDNAQNSTKNVGDYILSLDSSGIKYFLTKEAALSYTNPLAKNSWHPNGRPKFLHAQYDARNFSVFTHFSSDGSVKQMSNFKGNYEHVISISSEGKKYISQVGERDGLTIINDYEKLKKHSVLNLFYFLLMASSSGLNTLYVKTASLYY